MSVSELKKYEENKRELKNKIMDYLGQRKGQWVSEEELKEEVDFDFDYLELDEALTGEYWSVRKKIETKSAKIQKNGYYEYMDFYRYKPLIKSTRFWSIIVLFVVLVALVLFHFYRI